MANHLTQGQIRDLDENGYLVISEVLPDAYCEEVCRKMSRVWQELNPEMGKHDVAGVEFVGNAIQFLGADLEFGLLSPTVLDAARAVVGDSIRLNLVNYRTPLPGSDGQPLHDLSRRRGRPFVKCNAIWCLDEFTAQNGATRVLPRSHLNDRRALERMGDPLAEHPDEVVVEARRGSIIFHNSQLIHSGRANLADRARHSIHAAYTSPAVPTQYDWTHLPNGLTRGLSDDALDLLGLRHEYLAYDGV